MTTQIKVPRENMIKTLTSIKEDNVSIADIAISRRTLLAALKLQTDADLLTINYGKISWRESSEKHGISEVTGEPCIQISYNHTTMRFLNKPAGKSWLEPKIIPLNFVDQADYTKPKLIGTPLDTQELIKALSFVLPCVEKDEIREVLACVLFDSGNDTLKLVSADGFRLPIVPMVAKGIPQDKVLIHHTDISKLLTYLKAIKPAGNGKGKYYPEVYLAYKSKAIKFSSDNGTIELQKQKGTFPDYERLIPKDGNAKIEFISDDMLQAVKALSNIANDGSGIIRLQFQVGSPAGKILLTANSSIYSDDQHKASVECDAIVESDCKIAVNTKYLVDLLKLCGQVRITLRVKTPSDPMVCEVDGKTEVIMPMFVQWV